MKPSLILLFLLTWRSSLVFFFFFNDTATTEIYTLSLHDALPILCQPCPCQLGSRGPAHRRTRGSRDRKSTRLNSSHGYISYAVFCLKKKKNLIQRKLSTALISYKVQPNHQANIHVLIRHTTH